MSEKRTLIEPSAKPNTPSLRRQCALMGLSRSSGYEPPGGTGQLQESLTLMQRIDTLYPVYPFYGSRKIVAAIKREGFTVNCKRAERLMGIQSVAPKPSTSRPHPRHKVYP